MLITSGWIIFSLLLYIIVIAIPEKLALKRVKIMLHAIDSQKLEVFSVVTAIKGNAKAQPRMIVQAFAIKFLFLLSSLSEIMPAPIPETIPSTDRFSAFRVENAVLNPGNS